MKRILVSVLGTRSRIARGLFTSVVINQNLLYATDTNRNTVHVFYHDSGWKLRNKIKLQFKINGWTVTLRVKHDHLICSNLSWAHEVIRVYALDGSLVQTFGNRGSGGEGEFYFPFVADADVDGSVLITDCYNNRLQVMSEQGEFSVLQLQWPVSKPRGAMFFNNQLYVTSWSKQTLCKYMPNSLLN